MLYDLHVAGGKERWKADGGAGAESLERERRAERRGGVAGLGGGERRGIAKGGEAENGERSVAGGRYYVA